MALCRPEPLPRPRSTNPRAAVAEGRSGRLPRAKIKPRQCPIAHHRWQPGAGKPAECWPAIVAEVRATRCAIPFVVPAMGRPRGRHGRGTEPHFWLNWGVTGRKPSACENPLFDGNRMRSACCDNGSCRADGRRHANAADGIILFHASQPHTSFRAPKRKRLGQNASRCGPWQHRGRTCHSRGY